MIYSLEYYYTCHRGKARRINQDNLVCGETFLPVTHEDTLTGSSVPVTPDNPFLFAAFDGIGGEAYGESASGIAAETFHNWDFQRNE